MSVIIQINRYKILIIFQEAEINRRRFTLDFGYGFYTTTNSNQAVNFAGRVTSRRGSGAPHVSMYEVEEIEELKKNFKVLIFPKANEAWLDFVSENRNGVYVGERYDIIFGPVANDTIYRTIVAYEEGILTKEETIARLKVKKLYNQMTFTTEDALQQLNYIGQFHIEEEQHE